MTHDHHMTALMHLYFPAFVWENCEKKRTSVTLLPASSVWLRDYKPWELLLFQVSLFVLPLSTIERIIACI